MVDDKPYEWNKEKEHWKEIKAPKSGLTDVAGNTANTGTAAAATPAEAVAVDADVGSKIQLQLANLLNQQNAMATQQNTMINNQNEMKSAII